MTAELTRPGDERVTTAPGPPGAGRRTPVVLGTLSGVLVAAGAVLGLHVATLHNGLIAAACTAVGVFVLGRRPGNREAWLFLATGLAHAVLFAGRQYGLAAAAGTDLPAARWVMWLGVWPLAPVLVLFGVTLLCFPDGRLPSPRWRWVVGVMAVAGTLLAVASALWPIEYADNGLTLPHPLDVGGLETAQRLWNVLGPLCYMLFQLVWVVGVVVRLRRAGGDEARQLRWFVAAVAVGGAVMVLGLVTTGSPVPGLLAVPVVPLAAGAAILKYRLYDIDPVISAGLVVGAMAAVVTAGYVLVVVGVGRLVGVPPTPDPALSLLATALVAVAFDPARRRVRRLADRLVYGDRPSPYEALAQLSGELRRGGRHDDVVSGLASTVAAGVGAAEVTVWVGPPDALVAVASWPPAQDGAPALTPSPRQLATLQDGGREHVRPILHRGVLRGAVTLRKAPGHVLTPAEDRLLTDLVAQAGLVVDNLGLGTELEQRLAQISRQAAELQAAGRRIVAAQDEARRRIERDLHDGAQQRLVTLALDLQSLAGRAASSGDPALAAGLRDARVELSGALAELREMARGIHPAVLTQDGLEAALGSLAERSALPVRLDVRLGRRLPRDVEAAAYFVVGEALTNAARHSGASAVTVTAELREDRLAVEVTDDGRGGADGSWGGGLQGLADRLATWEGRLTVHSPAGGGTRLRAELPCG